MCQTCCSQNISFDTQQLTRKTLFIFNPNKHKAFCHTSRKKWCILQKQALRHFCHTELASFAGCLSTGVPLRATAASDHQKHGFFLKDHCVKCSSQISGWSTNTSMLHYTNTTLPAHESEQSPRSELWKYSMNSGGNWPELSSYKHKYISNHCSMPGKDNRGSDREKDCHLNNGMLNKASTPLNKMLLSSKAQQSIQCW